jgi:hypothetical protein
MSTLQEDAKRIQPLVEAIAEGKTVEYRLRDSVSWNDKTVLGFDLRNCEYRIKPEPKYRPYTREEWEKVDKVRDKTTGSVRAVVAVNECVCVYGLCAYGFDAAMDRFTHLDGSPCGVEE